MRSLCESKRRDGRPCRMKAITGTTACAFHCTEATPVSLVLPAWQMHGLINDAALQDREWEWGETGRTLTICEAIADAQDSQQALARDAAIERRARLASR